MWHFLLMILEWQVVLPIGTLHKRNFNILKLFLYHQKSLLFAYSLEDDLSIAEFECIHGYKYVQDNKIMGYRDGATVVFFGRP